ncbi:MAG TPA: ribosome silencing factor [Bacteroidia bacterium]|jgi:ribosome-associated protein|nr:ribosome silencing factor [Bacteroidia bacterium]
MRKTGKKKAPVQLKDVVLRSIADKKGKNVVCLNMTRISGSMCDYFVICEGDSSVQVGTIAKAIEEEVKKATGENAYHREGYENAEWILIDYVDIVIHIFQPHVRGFYNLESLWADAESEEIAIEREYKHV